jgi:hypothetical protein
MPATDDDSAFQEWLRENQHEVKKLMKEEKAIEDASGVETPAPTTKPSYPERIVTPAPSPDPNMDDPCSLLNEQSCDPVSTICFEDTRRRMKEDTVDVADAADVADYYNSAGEKIDGDDDFQQFLMDHPEEQNKLYQVKEPMLRYSSPTHAPTDSTGVTRIHSDDEAYGARAETALGIFAKRHRAVLHTSSPTPEPTNAPSVLLAAHNPTPPPTPKPTPLAGPEFVDSFHCACRQGFIKDPKNLTHCFKALFTMEGEDGSSFIGSYGGDSGQTKELERGPDDTLITEETWIAGVADHADEPLPVIALFAIFAAPFGVVIVRKRRAAARASLQPETPEASSPASMHAAGSGAAGSIDIVGSPRRGPPNPVAPMPSPALKPQTTKWLVKGDHYHSTSI